MLNLRNFSSASLLLLGLFIVCSLHSKNAVAQHKKHKRKHITNNKNARTQHGQLSPKHDAMPYQPNGKQQQLSTSTDNTTFIQKRVHGINFFEGSLKDAKAEARRTGKPLFVDVTASWCLPCLGMDEDVFSKKDIGIYYNTYFISYKLDFDSEEGRQFSKKHNFKSVPYIAYFDNYGKKVYHNEGMQDKNQVMVNAFNVLTKLNITTPGIVYSGDTVVTTYALRDPFPNRTEQVSVSDYEAALLKEEQARLAEEQSYELIFEPGVLAPIIIDEDPKPVYTPPVQTTRAPVPPKPQPIKRTPNSPTIYDDWLDHGDEVQTPTYTAPVTAPTPSAPIQGEPTIYDRWQEEQAPTQQRINGYNNNFDQSNTTPSTGNTLFKAQPTAGSSSSNNVQLVAGMTPLNDYQLIQMENRFLNGEKGNLFLRRYAYALQQRNDAKAAKVANKFIKKYARGEKWKNKEARQFIYDLAVNFNSGATQHLVKHKDAFVRWYGENAVNNQISTGIAAAVTNAAITKNKYLFRSAMTTAKRADLPSFNSFEYNLRSAYLQGIKDYPTYIRLTHKYIDKLEKPDIVLLHRKANELIRLGSKKAHFRIARKWAKEATKRDAHYTSFITLARAEQKLGRKKAAHKAAKRAIAYAQQSGIDTREARSIILK